MTITGFDRTDRLQGSISDLNIRGQHNTFPTPKPEQPTIACCLTLLALLWQNMDMLKLLGETVWVLGSLMSWL
jgi:hypothetical protein